MAKQEQRFAIIDDDNNELLDSDIYSSEKNAIDYATDIINDCGDDASVTVVKLVPIVRVKRNTAVTVEKV